MLQKIRKKIALILEICVIDLLIEKCFNVWN